MDKEYPNGDTFHGDCVGDGVVGGWGGGRKERILCGIFSHGSDGDYCAGGGRVKIVAVVVKYADNVLKVFATSFSKYFVIVFDIGSVV